MIVHIDRQLAYVGNRPLFKLPKGRKTRGVPISRGLLEVIDDYMDAYPPVTITLPWGKTTGDPISVPLLIVTAANRVDTGCEFNYRHWRSAFTTAGLTYVEGEDGMHALLRLDSAGSRRHDQRAGRVHRPLRPRFHRAHVHAPAALQPRASADEPWTASSSRADRKRWSRVLGRPDDGLGRYVHLVTAGQRRGAREARLLLTWQAGP